MNKKEFLSQMPQNNTEWAAQQIANNLGNLDFKMLQRAIGILDETLNKQWAQELTLAELKEAIQLVKNLKK